MNRKRAVWIGIVLLLVSILGRLETADVPLYTWERRPAPDTQEMIVVQRNNFTGEALTYRVGLPLPRTDPAPQR